MPISKPFPETCPSISGQPTNPPNQILLLTYKSGHPSTTMPLMGQQLQSLMVEEEPKQQCHDPHIPWLSHPSKHLTGPDGRAGEKV
jgi:hypothetical protein